MIVLLICICINKQFTFCTFSLLLWQKKTLNLQTCCDENVQISFSCAQSQTGIMILDWNLMSSQASLTNIHNKPCVLQPIWWNIFLLSLYASGTCFSSFHLAFYVVITRHKTAFKKNIDQVKCSQVCVSCFWVSCVDLHKTVVVLFSWRWFHLTEKCVVFLRKFSI